MEENKLGNPLLCEIKIHTQDLTLEQRYDIIKDVYNEILWEDELWHFFYEEEMGDIIRCSPEFFKTVMKYFNTKYPDVKYYWSDVWFETIEEVVNNPEYFAEIFHINSEFTINKALKYKKDIGTFIDRFTHSLYLCDGFVNQLRNDRPESTLLATAGLDRSFYEGMRFQYKRSLEAYKKEQNGDKS